jgi:tRNA 2-thiouridine synthesizing protein A
MKCPRPIIEVARRIREVNVGSLLELLADDPAAGLTWPHGAGCAANLVASDAPRFIVRRVLINNNDELLPRAGVRNRVQISGS